MAASSQGFHEAFETLTPKTRDLHRALASLMEELEAIDWYQQRVDAAQDEELKAILAHNRDEEKEHAAMVLEWIRRQDPVLSGHLKNYLFVEGSIVGREEKVDAKEREAGNGRSPANLPLSVGSLKGAKHGLAET